MNVTYAPAASPSLAVRLSALFDMLGRFPIAALELMFRVGVGAVFFKSGLVKIQSWESTIALFHDEYRVPLLPPEIAAYLGTAAELICPILIIAGLGARLGAAALLGMTFVIQVFVYPENWAEHLIWAGLLTYILTRGAGVVSADHWIAQAYRGRS